VDDATGQRWVRQSSSVETIDVDFDLNALRLLVALDDTRNVTRAAELLDMSQSGFSTALARLRKRLNNPLFVRTNNGMEATPRAAKMAETARDILARVKNGILDEGEFHPLTERAHFALSMADVAEVVFLPHLLAQLRAVAPHVTIQGESHRKDELQGEMESGRMDLALGYFPELGSNAFYQQRLYSHTYASMLRPGHPALKKPMTKEVYAGLGHAVVMSPARTNELFERSLEQKRITRTVVVRTPHHLSLPSIVSETDLIATVPLATGAYFANLGTVVLVPLPFRPPRRCSTTRQTAGLRPSASSMGTSVHGRADVIGYGRAPQA
jgi:DNA-binding transcriptional LysR family regulator